MPSTAAAATIPRVILYWYATSGVTADLANSANNTGDAAEDTYSSIENLRGTAFNDTLRGKPTTTH